MNRILVNYWEGSSSTTWIDFIRNINYYKNGLSTHGGGFIIFIKEIRLTDCRCCQCVEEYHHRSRKSYRDISSLVVSLLAIAIDVWILFPSFLTCSLDLGPHAAQQRWTKYKYYDRIYINPYPVFFLGPSPSVFSGKKIQSTEIYTNLLNAALWIFLPRNTLGDGPAFWIFFPGFKDKG